MRAAPDALFKALGDPTRRALFERLARDGEQTESAHRQGQSLAAGGLEAPGRPQARRARAGPAPRTRNALQHRPQGLAPLVDWMNFYTAFWHDRFKRLEELLKRMDQ